MTKRVLVLGTGHIGRSVAHLLRTAQGEPAYEVWVGDRVVSKEIRAEFPGRCFEIEGSNVESFASRIKGQDILVNALPFHLASTVAAAAAAERVHYFDLTEDVSATRTIRDLARDAKTAFMPQCGLARASSPSPAMRYPRGTKSCSGFTCAWERCRSTPPTR